MSRVGRLPIALSPDVKVEIEGSHVTIRGPRGELSRELHPDMRLDLGDGELRVARPSDAPRHRSLHGLTRTLLANMVAGVQKGFTKTLEMQGVGYRAQQQGDRLVLSVGLSHTVEIAPPEGITLEVEGTSRIHVRGIDKEKVGQVAAEIRRVRPPEPYKGKGIRYLGEHVRRKAGKAGKAVR
jgi:large subunit ribosomal protein L6